MKIFKFKKAGFFTAQLLLIIILVSCSGTKSISILETTDLHGVILPYDFIEKEKIDVSLASTYTYLKQVRAEKDITILLDNGDNLQGQPTIYYYNFIDTISPHIGAEVMNYMGYDAGTVGNHDVEAGHAVYDRLVREYNFPLLAANAVDIKTGEPYFKPYHIIIRNGIKIAVFGMVTPAIPTWLPEELYKGIEFRDMVETAKKWMPIMQNEKPDLVIGLFHSGWDGSREEYKTISPLTENGSAAVAYNVPGFDIIFNGHDHRLANEKFLNAAGDTILILNGGSKSENIAQADIVISSKKIKGKKIRKITGQIIKVAEYKPDPEFIEKFTPQHKTVDEYVNRVIGNSSSTITSRDAYFGPSAFVDMIHSVQMEITGADLSFAAPLSFDVSISKGPITVSDMFKLYRFENFLYTMSLSGEEIQKYLEYSYSEWVNTMRSSGDLLLKLRTDKDGKLLLTNGKAWFRNQSYNFDSGSGIDYTVDVSKPEGSRITIAGFTNGKPFEKNKTYKVAVNSYRGNGGGGHFTEGAGIDKNELRSRILTSTDRDLRYYFLKSIEEKKTVNPIPINNWKFIPEKWVSTAGKKEYKLLFGEN
ncbi:MAG: bifunctional metallophosphatase/5'-nucleotidase [Bacteroidales bacterium]|nr:bifunctional metallophosphatase/5'-nucleotidase [Bacteroidales bacterium]